MEIEKQSSYKRLADWLDTQRKQAMNGVVVTFPGCGFSHRAEKYISGKKNVKMILKEGEQLSRFNILNLNFVSNDLATKIAEDYLRIATIDQKIVVVIDDVSILESEKYKSSYLSSHVYDFFWFGAFDENGVKEVVQDLGGSGFKFDDLYKLSGGISRLVKYLCLKATSLDLEKLISDLSLQSICRPMVEVIKKSSEKDVEKLGIVSEGKIRSEILRRMMVGASGLTLNIKIGKDLTLVEDGIPGEKLARVEKEILTQLLESEGYLSREKVAELKWGSEDFSEFSDQAINKTMRRLSIKMKKYAIETIWKTGYKLIKK